MQVLAVEEHVDYWDYLGWRDPYSSRDWSQRQADYQPAFGRSRIYTPQMVVDGADELVGSDEDRARAAIATAARRPKGKVTLQRLGDRLRVSVDELPPSQGTAQILLAVVEAGLVSKVERGENEGRTLSHAPVLRSLRTIGEIAQGARSASAEVELALPPGGKVRAIVFVQQARGRRVLAVGSI